MFLPNDIINVILLFLCEYELVEWILVEKLHWDWLSANPTAIHLLEQNKDKIYWDSLSLNPAAIHLLEQHKAKINWDRISENPSSFTHIPKQTLKLIFQQF